MAKGTTVRLRDRRMPGHFWADNELFDVFGDALGSNALLVYLVLTRHCYVATAKLSLREVAAEARFGGDNPATGANRARAALKRLVDLGLVIETKAGTQRGVSSWSLVDVKKLALEFHEKRLACGDLLLQAARGSVDDTTPALEVGESPAPVLDAANCRIARQPGIVEDAARLSHGATQLSQERCDFATELSHGASPSIKQDTRHKTQDKYPPTPLLGSQGRAAVGIPSALGSEGSEVREGREGRGRRQEVQEQGQRQRQGLPGEGKGESNRNGDDERKGKGKAQAEPGVEPEVQPDVERAVARVMRECRVSEPRMRRVLRFALVQEAGRTDEAECGGEHWDGIAARMVGAFAEYSWLAGRGLIVRPVRSRRFFSELWANQGLWEIDRERLAVMNQASVGSR